MANIPLNKEVYSKTQFQKVVNTDFTQLVSVTTQPTSSIPSVESVNVKIIGFFNEYNSLFYDIPKFGDTNSHEYLVKTSGEYIGTISTPDSTIQALIEEINQLRQDNLALQQQITPGSI
jgi:hypothetical protein